MTYTLFMPADQGIQIAEDGVAEISMTYARANLTPLLRGVRYGDGVGAFTERGERSAYVVTPGFYERAKHDRRALESLKEAIATLGTDDANRFLIRWVEQMTDD